MAAVWTVSMMPIGRRLHKGARTTKNHEETAGCICGFVSSCLPRWLTALAQRYSRIKSEVYIIHLSTTHYYGTNGIAGSTAETTR
jgi:hypothetical protein